MFMYKIKYMTSLRVKDASRVAMHNFQMNIFIQKQTLFIKSVSVIQEGMVNFVSAAQRRFYW